MSKEEKKTSAEPDELTATPGNPSKKASAEPQAKSLMEEVTATPSKPSKKASAESQEVTATPGKPSKENSKEKVVVRKEKKGAATRKQRRHSRERVVKVKEKEKEKAAAESVLFDPRQRESRLWLVRACGMEKEREVFDKRFEEDTKAKGRSRNCSDTSTQDKNDDDARDTDKKRKARNKKDEAVREEFHNEKKGQDSPNAKTPEAGSTMLEEMDFDLRVMAVTHVKKLTVWKLAFVLMSNFFRLPIFLVITKYYVMYGISFIGVMAVMMGLIGVPLVCLELSMGQFTSLPPNTFFARISPIAQGIGFSMIIVRIYALAAIHVDIRYLFLFIQHLSLMSGAPDERCANSGMPFCHTYDMCGADLEPGLYGSCVTPPDPKRTVGFKDQVLGEVLRIRALHSSPTRLLVDNELTEHNAYSMFTFCAIMAICGMPLIDGAEFITSASKVYALAAFLTPIVIFANLDMLTEYNKWRAGWNGDMDAFSDPYAWIVAFCLMCSMYNVGEGTWMFIGSWLNFRHPKIIRSVYYCVIGQTLLMFGLAYGFTAWAVNVVHYQHNGYLTHGEVLDILRDRPLEFWLTLPTKVIPDKHDSLMFLAYGLFTFNSLGYVVLTGEYLLVSVQRGFPFLCRINRVQLRGTALVLMTGSAVVVSPLLHDSHIFANAHLHYAFLGMQLFVIFYEMMIFVYVYGLQRVLVNFKGIRRYDSTSNITFSKLTGYLRIVYRFIIPWLVLLGFAYVSAFYEVNNFSFLSIIFMTAVMLPWLVGIVKISRHSETQHAVVTLFRADARFGPSAVADRKMAASEENKMGGTN